MKVAKLRSVFILLSFFFVAADASALAEDRLAPGTPGKDAEWSSAGKQAAGTANSLASKVWLWSMAQFIRLALNLRQRKNLDTPDIVARRYLR
jgi:Glucodextranase, domain N